MCFDITIFFLIYLLHPKRSCHVFGNSLSGASFAANIGAGLAHSQNYPTHAQHIFQRVLCNVPTFLRVFIFRVIKETFL